jgi:putative membrane protein
MRFAANAVVALIGLLHVWILVLEMFLWDKPTGRRAFGQTQEFATATKVLAANQGLYNGFLAAGLFWGLSLGPAGTGVKVFFLLLPGSRMLLSMVLMSVRPHSAMLRSSSLWMISSALVTPASPPAPRP